MSRHEPACTGTKTCHRCGRTLHVLAFAVAPTSKDGLDSNCRECHSEVNRHYRADHPTKTPLANPIVPEDTYDS